jgi:crossover junction endodeoxyribonuclease RuvC
MLRVVGIDVGLLGAAALIERSQGDDLGDGQLGRRQDRIVDVIDLPTVGEDAQKRILVPELKKWLVAMHGDVAFLEDVHAMPKQGVASTFKFGRAAGAIEATVACVGLPWRLVTPVLWKRAMSLKGKDKEPSRQLVLQRFPEQTGYFTRMLDHQRAEACLIAVFGCDLIERERSQAA